MIITASLLFLYLLEYYFDILGVYIALFKCRINFRGLNLIREKKTVDLATSTQCQFVCTSRYLAIIQRFINTSSRLNKGSHNCDGV